MPAPRFAADGSLITGPRAWSPFLRGAIVLVLTLATGLLAVWAGGGALIAASIAAAGVFIFGVVLWRSSNDRKIDEIGRTIMVAVPLAIVVGAPQFLIDRSQKRRDFIQSLTLQDDLRGADLHDQDLRKVRLRGKDLSNADLRHADLRNANLVDTTLRGANLSFAKLQKADLRRAHLEGASFEGAHLERANLEDADMAGSRLPHAHLSRANLQITGLTSSCMAGADLYKADLTGADLAGAVLTGANVRDVEFEDDLKPARVELAGLAGVQSDRTTHWPIHFKTSQDAARGVPRTGRNVPPARPTGKLVPARIVHVFDGDTILIEAKGVPAPGRTRLIGLDAPDLAARGGESAKQALRKLLRGQRVLLEVGTTPQDARSRSLVNLWHADGRRTYNEDLLEIGVAFTKFPKQKDKGLKGEHVKLVNAELKPQFEAAELRAKQMGIGIWGTCPRSEFEG
jgi:uncharacterized protein YjbI with pentapeptide repeats/endonuclease YncB( thermonuclease family)